MDNKSAEITALVVREETHDTVKAENTESTVNSGDTVSETKVESHTENASRRFNISNIVKTIALHVIPSALAAVSLLVYTTLGVALVSGKDMTVVSFAKSLLRDLSPGLIYSNVSDRSDISENAPLNDSDVNIISGKNGETNDEVILPDIRSEASPKPDFTKNSAAADKTDQGSSDKNGEKKTAQRITIDMSSDSEYSLGLTNETPYEVDLTALSQSERAIPPYVPDQSSASDAPVALIIHTHTSEGYIDTALTGFRSDDPAAGVRYIGESVATLLNERGIPVLHCTEVFDSPDFNMAYYNAALAIKKYLNDYPSIEYIIDLHRDSILSSEKGVQIAPVAEVDGHNVAQLMFVVGTDYGGSGHASWRDNLSLAARIQRSISEKYPSLMRDINLRSASFNEQYTSGSLLVEVGSAASTIDEASEAGRIFASFFADEILGKNNDN